jgi:hypothetical protein
MALAKAGCAVEVICPSRHPITKTKIGIKTHAYEGLAPLRSFAAALAAAQPDLIIPTDDLATYHLHSLYRLERTKNQTDCSTCSLIERSLGSAESFRFAYSRAAFLQLAREENILAPRTDAISNLDDLKNWLLQNGLPAVLKVNETSGGLGVRVVCTFEEAECAFRSLQTPPALLRAVKRSLIDREASLLRSALFRRRPGVNAQVFVAGEEATSTIACWHGKVLAALHFQVIDRRGPGAPATVLRLVENPDISSAVEKIARRLTLSGLHGFDFMLQDQTGTPYLIEMNPRATQVGHLALGPGRDLAAALYAALSGKAVRPAPKVTENDTIALFPHEWIRDPESPFLRSAYHDVPWEEPELVRDCVKASARQRGWYSQTNQSNILAPSRKDRGKK